MNKETESIRKTPNEIWLNQSAIGELVKLHFDSRAVFHRLGKVVKQKENQREELGGKNLTEELNFKRIKKQIAFISQQRKSLAERGRIAYWLFHGLKNSLEHIHQRYDPPKIIPVEEGGKVTLRLSAGTRWLKFGEETFNSLLEIFYPGHENTLEHKKLKILVFKEKREIVLKI